MKKKNLFCSLLVLTNLLFVTSCSEKLDSSSLVSSSIDATSNESSNVEISSSETSSEETKEIKFESKSVEYDGKSHSLEVENLPEGASVTYKGNGKTNPGEYSISASVTYSDGSKETFKAVLTITKLASVLTAETVQEAFAYTDAVPTYSLNNTSQRVSVSPMNLPGVYVIDLYAQESKFYQESNHVTVTFTIKAGNELGITFDSKDFVADGSEKEITAENIPLGYTVEYENNKATLPGKYNAKCTVYDSSKQAVMSLNAIMTIDKPKNQDFEDYLDQFFIDYLGDDYIAWNIFTEHPDTFGFVRDENDKATWYTYETLDSDYKVEAYQEMLDEKAKLTAFDVNTLSSGQLVSYRVIEDTIDSYIEYYNPESSYDFLMEMHYIDQFGGYAADFGTYMEAYELRSEQDVKDVISYIESLPTAFDSYLTYADDRVNAGYPLSDYTLTEMISYLDDVVEDGDDYYLVSFLTNKVDNCSFLSEEQKENYKAKIVSVMKDSFMVAYYSLAEGLENYKGKCDSSKEGYWASYGEAGKQEFVYNLKDLLGIKELDLDEYEAYLKNVIDTYSGEINSLLNSVDTKVYNEFLKYYGGKSLVGINDPYEMLDYLKEFAKTIVPDLENEPDIDVKYMDESVAKVSNAVAYYMKSALDSTDSEHITLNGVNLASDYNDALATLAHEGYPGHLYAYCFDKQLDISNIAKIMTSTAHGEGWATYVSLKLYEYIKSHNNAISDNQQKAIEFYCDYMYYNDLLAYNTYTYCDYMIHVKGWTASNVASLFGTLGFNTDAAKDVYLTLIETPTTYAAYGYGMAYFVDLHDNAKAKLGKYYSEVDFNSAVLSHGWVGLDELKRITDEYIEDTLYIHGVSTSN